jgi:uncharacterized membrane protein YeiB
MKMDRRQRIILGIVLVNLSIFLFSAIWFTKQDSYFWTGEISESSKFFLKLISRKDWGVSLMILFCTSLCSTGIYLISVKSKS